MGQHNPAIAAERNGNLMQDVLTLSKLDAGALRIRLESVEVSDVVRHAVSSVRPALEQNPNAERVCLLAARPTLLRRSDGLATCAVVPETLIARTRFDSLVLVTGHYDAVSDVCSSTEVPGRPTAPGTVTGSSTPKISTGSRPKLRTISGAGGGAGAGRRPGGVPGAADGRAGRGAVTGGAEIGGGLPARVCQDRVGSAVNLVRDYVPATRSRSRMSTSPARTSRRPTYADIEALPEGVNGEILGGELVVSPRPAAPHTHTASVLGALLMPPFHLGRGGPGGWWVYHEPELSLGVDPDYDPVIPDLAGWRRTTMERPPATAQYRVPPDWVCEVVSPSTARHDRALKLPFYGRAGVSHAWIVDPLARTIEVFAATGGGWVLAAVVSGEGEAALAPFADVPLPLDALWAPTDSEGERP